MVEIQPLKVAAFAQEQSPSPHLPKLPVRMIVSGQSGAGKGVTVANMLLRPELYRDCFEKIYYFSASGALDGNLKPLKDYCENVLKMDPESEPCLFDSWDTPALEEIIDRQRKVIAALKRDGKKKLPGIAIIVDDLADDRKATHGPHLKQLFLRGRHSFISTFVLTQKYRLLDNSIRINATALLAFRSRSVADRDAILDENAALVGRAALEELLDHATRQPYAFLYIDLMAPAVDKMFYRGFLARLLPPS